jgi:putative Mg2+ transporter-C (MgtC) family protein
LCIGSCLYGIIAIRLAGNQLAEVARTLGQVAAGVGFLGAGAIFKSESKVQGLTSGALIWMCAGVGLAVGVGLTQLAVEVTLLAIVLIYFLRLIHWFLRFGLSRYR